MFNVCLSWSYCSCKSLAKLKCEIDVYVSMKRLLSLLFLWCYSSIFDDLFSPPLTHSVGRISLNSNLALSQISKERGELLWGNYYYIYYILNTITIYTILLYILKVLSFLSSDKAFTTADMRFIEGEWKNTTVSDWGECTFAIPNIRQVN